MWVNRRVEVNVEDNLDPSLEILYSEIRKNSRCVRQRCHQFCFQVKSKHVAAQRIIKCNTMKWIWLFAICFQLFVMVCDSGQSTFYTTNCLTDRSPHLGAAGYSCKLREYWSSSSSTVLSS